METKNMNAKKGMWALSLLLTLALAGAMFVPAVSAEQLDDQQFAQEQYIGLGGMELTHTSCGALKTSYDWIAGTDIYKVYLGPVESKHYSKSRISGTSTPYDISKIGVRGRVWKDDNSKFDETDTNFNSADASVNYQSTETFLSGYWEAKSDHTFEYPANNDYWYPVTTDDLDL